MLPTIPVTEPTHWVPATQPSLTSVLPLSRLQSPPDRFTGRKYRKFTGYREICCSHHPSADSRLTSYRVYRLQREFSGYTEICCSHHPSADSSLTGYIVYRLQRNQLFPWAEDNLNQPVSSEDNRFTSYRDLPVTDRQEVLQ